MMGMGIDVARMWHAIGISRQMPKQLPKMMLLTCANNLRIFSAR
jgi:hypothetical protein